ncbi:MAG TPA: MFS transporter [Patescibacteria group bacterium]|nr:MFS transporter [Patescibacteria group bacterium]
MTGRPVGGDRAWFALLLVMATLLQAATAVARPMASYRALQIGMDPGSLGFVAAAFAIAPVVFALSIGRRIDRWGPFVFLLGSTIVMVVASIGLALADSAPLLLLVIGMLGLGQLVFVVADQTLVGSRTPSGAYDSRFGSLSFVASLGQLIGPAAAGLIAADGSPEGTSRALLFGAVLSIAAIPLAIRLWQRDPGPAVPAPSIRPVAPGVLSILRMPGMGPAMLASLTVLATMDVITVYLPALGEERGLSVATVGALLAIRAGASMASRLFLGRLVDVVGRERLLVGSLGVAAVSVIVLPFVPLPLAFVVMAIAGTTLGIGQPMTMSWVAARATEAARGTAMSLRLLGNRVGQVVIPLAAGSVAAVTGTAGVLAAAGLTVAVSAVVVARRRPPDQDPDPG